MLLNVATNFLQFEKAVSSRFEKKRYKKIHGCSGVKGIRVFQQILQSRKRWEQHEECVEGANEQSPGIPDGKRNRKKKAKVVALRSVKRKGHKKWAKELYDLESQHDLVGIESRDKDVKQEQGRRQARRETERERGRERGRKRARARERESGIGIEGEQRETERRFPRSAEVMDFSSVKARTRLKIHGSFRKIKAIFLSSGAGDHFQIRWLSRTFLAAADFRLIFLRLPRYFVSNWFRKGKRTGNIRSRGVAGRASGSKRVFPDFFSFVFTSRVRIIPFELIASRSISLSA